MKKFKKLVPAAIVWVALPVLTQVTMNGAQVSLETGELSAMGTALTDWGSSLLNVWIQILPYLVAFTIIMMVFGLIKNLWNLKARWGGRWRRRSRR